MKLHTVTARVSNLEKMMLLYWNVKQKVASTDGAQRSRWIHHMVRLELAIEGTLRGNEYGRRFRFGQQAVQQAVQQYGPGSWQAAGSAVAILN